MNSNKVYVIFVLVIIIYHYLKKSTLQVYIFAYLGRKTFRENIYETSPNFCPYEAQTYLIDEINKKPLSVVDMPKKSSLKVIYLKV